MVNFVSVLKKELRKLKNEQLLLLELAVEKEKERRRIN